MVFSPVFRRLAVIFLSAFSLLAMAEEGLVVRMASVHGANSQYALGLIRIALAYSGKNYSFTSDAVGGQPERQVMAVIAKTQDIMWASTKTEFEEDLHPIRVPLFRGLMGYRVLMIRKGDQARFNHIKTVKDLNTVSIAQGRGWADTEILVANAIEVMEVTKYQGLFFMLDGGRFDAFPRGIHEPWKEMDEYPDLNLAVESNILLVYRMPFYLFVGKDNHALISDLESGLFRAIEDGSFNEYFLKNPVVKNALAQSKMENRIVFHMVNPMLPVETPLDDSRLWIDPANL